MEKVKFARGIIRVHEIPVDWSEAEYRYWWLPEKDNVGRVIRTAA